MKNKLLMMIVIGMGFIILFGIFGMMSVTGSEVNQTVTVIILNGTEIGNETIEPLCILESDDVDLIADVDFRDCLGEVWIEVKIGDGNWTSYYSVNYIDSVYLFILNNSLLNGNAGKMVYYQFFAKDCYNHTYNGSVNSFYVNSKTYLIVNPFSPNGLNGWYRVAPVFTLENSDAIHKFYRWNGNPRINYTHPFGLEDIPNAPPFESAGILDLTYFSDTVCGQEKWTTEIFYIDLTAPVITDLVPADNGIVYNNLKPTISAYLDEVYQSNSGIDDSSIIMKLDGEEIIPVITNEDFLDRSLVYNPDSDLSEGSHEVYIYVKDNAGWSSELTWNFEIVLTSIFDMNVYSPINNEIYNSRRIVFNISSSEKIDIMEYIKLRDNVPRWKKLCSECDEYGFYKKKTKSFKDGYNNLSIKGIDKFGFIKEVNLTFFIDSIKPKISQLYPRRNALINGSEFYIKYSEDNLEGIELFYGVEGDIRNKSLNGCLAGKNQECSIGFELNELDNFNNKWIEYWFVVEDSINVVESKKIKVRVDNVIPVLNNRDSFWTQGEGKKSKYIYFSLNITEDNFKKVEYIDYNDKNPKWRTLCSSLKNGICEKKKSFKKTEHEVDVRIIDDAGNSLLIEGVDFEVDY